VNSLSTKDHGYRKHSAAYTETFQSAVVFTSRCLVTDLNNLKSKLRVCYNRRSVSVGKQFGAQDELFFPFSSRLNLDSCGFVIMDRPLWREVASVVYSCCWASPAQSFLGPGTAGLMTILSSLRARFLFAAGLCWVCTNHGENTTPPFLLKLFRISNGCRIPAFRRSTRNNALRLTYFQT
jgi:hypothetical protein